MGSTFDFDTKCPECGKNTGFADYYYKTGEEYFACQNKDCLMEFTYLYKRDKDNKLVTIDGTDNYAYSNLIMVETVIKNGKKTVTELNQNKDE